MDLKTRILLIALGYIAFAIFVFLGMPKLIPLSQETYVADYVKVVGLGITVLTGLSAGLLPFALSPAIETRKRVSVETVDSYKILYAALRAYYRSLARMEAGAWTVADSQVAENGMELAEGSLAFVSDDTEQEWTDGWQAMHALAERVSHDPGSQRDAWKQEARRMGARLNSFKTRVRSEALLS